jgi:hypothetical protein
MTPSIHAGPAHRSAPTEASRAQGTWGVWAQHAQPPFSCRLWTMALLSASEVAHGC